jgi:hypothetical protein
MTNTILLTRETSGYNLICEDLIYESLAFIFRKFLFHNLVTSDSRMRSCFVVDCRAGAALRAVTDQRYRQ